MKNFFRIINKIKIKIKKKRKFNFFKLQKNYIYKKKNKEFKKFKKFDLEYELKIIKNLDEFSKIFPNYNFTSFSKEEIINHLKYECELIIVIFLGKIVHIRYLSLNQKSKDFLEPRFPVNFNNEATFGGGFTIPEFRRKGINNFVIYKMMEYFSKKNIESMIYSINIHNNASILSHSSFDNKLVGKGYILNILFLQIIIVIEKNE